MSFYRIISCQELHKIADEVEGEAEATNRYPSILAVAIEVATEEVVEVLADLEEMETEVVAALVDNEVIEEEDMGGEVTEEEVVGLRLKSKSSGKFIVLHC